VTIPGRNSDVSELHAPWKGTSGTPDVREPPHCRYPVSETAPIVAWLKAEAEVLELAAGIDPGAAKTFILMAATLRGAGLVIADGLPQDAPGFSMFSRLAAERTQGGAW
jgi:hypothetical protein